MLRSNTVVINKFAVADLLTYIPNYQEGKKSIIASHNCSLKLNIFIEILNESIMIIIDVVRIVKR